MALNPRTKIDPDQIPKAEDISTASLLNACGLTEYSSRSEAFLKQNGYEDFDHFQSWYDDGRVSEELWDKYGLCVSLDKNFQEYAVRVEKWLTMQQTTAKCIPILVEQVERLQEEVDQLLESE
jgi:hypothetical protein